VALFANVCHSVISSCTAGKIDGGKSFGLAAASTTVGVLDTNGMDVRRSNAGLYDVRRPPRRNAEAARVVRRSSACTLDTRFATTTGVDRGAGEDAGNWADIEGESSFGRSARVQNSRASSAHYW